MSTHSSQLRLLLRHSGSAIDTSMADEFLRHLRVLERFGAIKVWTDDLLLAGDHTDERIKQAIGDADIALLLLSPDFLASDDLHDSELPMILACAAHGDLRIILVVLRSCVWEADPALADLPRLPKDGKPVAAHNGDDRDRILAALVREVAALASVALPPVEFPPAPSLPHNGATGSPTPSQRILLSGGRGRSRSVKRLAFLVALLAVITPTVHYAWFAWFDLPSRLAASRLPTDKLGILVLSFSDASGNVDALGQDYALALYADIDALINDPANKHLRSITAATLLGGATRWPRGGVSTPEDAASIAAQTNATLVLWGVHCNTAKVCETAVSTFDRRLPAEHTMSIRGRSGELEKALYNSSEFRVLRLDQRRLVDFVIGLTYLRDPRKRNFDRAAYHLDRAYCSQIELTTSTNGCSYTVGLSDNAEVGLRLVEAQVFSASTQSSSATLDEIEAVVSDGMTRDREQLARVWNLRGMAAFRQGDYKIPRTHFERAVGLARELDSATLLSKFIGNLANTYAMQCESDRSEVTCQKALDLYDEAATFAHRCSNSEDERKWAAQRSVPYSLMGRVDDALANNASAMKSDREAGDPGALAKTVAQRAKILMDAGRHQEAKGAAQECIQLAIQVGDDLQEASCYGYLGTTCSALSERATAKDSYEKALSIYSKYQDAFHQAKAARLRDKLRATGDAE